jgi:hypothetical protein
VAHEIKLLWCSVLHSPGQPGMRAYSGDLPYSILSYTAVAAPPPNSARRNLLSWRRPRFFVSSSQTTSCRQGSLHLARTRRAASTWTRPPRRPMLRMIPLRICRHTTSSRSRCHDGQRAIGGAGRNQDVWYDRVHDVDETATQSCVEKKGKALQDMSRRHLVRCTSSTSRQDFVPSVTKPMSAASSASPTTIVPQTCHEPVHCFHCFHSGHRARDCGRENTARHFSHLRDASRDHPHAPSFHEPPSVSPLSDIIKSKELLSLQAFFVSQVATLRDEIQQIVATATLPLYARLLELQNKIHDWLKSTENFVLDLEHQLEQREIHGTCAAVRESERLSREHDVVGISQAASGLVAQIPPGRFMRCSTDCCRTCHRLKRTSLQVPSLNEMWRTHFRGLRWLLISMPKGTWLQPLSMTTLAYRCYVPLKS